MEEIKNVFVELLSEPSRLSKVRKVENASVKLRFRVMTEVKTEGNILNPIKYPNIGDDTISLVIPVSDLEDVKRETFRMELVLGKKLSELTSFQLKHPLNGYFLVFQAMF